MYLQLIFEYLTKIQLRLQIRNSLRSIPLRPLKIIGIIIISKVLRRLNQRGGQLGPWLVLVQDAKQRISLWLLNFFVNDEFLPGRLEVYALLLVQLLLDLVPGKGHWLVLEGILPSWLVQVHHLLHFAASELSASRFIVARVWLLF